MENLQLQNRRGPAALEFLLVIVGLLAVLLAACSAQKGGSAPTITTVKLKELADSGEEFFLLDVRTEPEFIAARLPFTDLRIPYDSLEAYQELLPEDTTMPIYTFCRTGRRSDIAARYLISRGYQNVANVAGGIKEWQSRGWETESGRPAEQ